MHASQTIHWVQQQPTWQVLLASRLVMLAWAAQ
jgi:hypothetical protein